MTTQDEKGVYARAREKFVEQSYKLEDQWFYAEDAYKLLNCDRSRYDRRNGADLNAEFRQAVSRVLYELSRNRKPFLEQNGKRYRIIKTDFARLKPNQAKSSKYDISFPTGRADNSEFSFAQTVSIHQGDVMGLGGEGNKGKSSFALNLAVENCDKHDVTLIISENEHLLDERLEMIDWKDIFTEDKLDWKFEVIPEKDNNKFLDIVRARRDNLVIIDWLDASKDSYMVGQFYRQASDLLGNGVCFIIQQKRSYKEWAQGGEASKDYSSLFLLIKSIGINGSVLYVEKCKSFDYFNPSRYMYRFDMKNRGTKFSGIHEVEACHACKGTGRFKNEKCPTCWGLGYTDVIQESI